MKVGDLIHYSDGDRTHGASGVIIVTGVLIPEAPLPLVSVLWADGNVGLAYEDEIKVISESR